MRLIVVLAIAALSGGCMSAPKTGAVASTDVDAAKMALIEKHAARVGVQVIWINPPLKSASPSGT